MVFPELARQCTLSEFMYVDDLVLIIEIIDGTNL